MALGGLLLGIIAIFLPPFPVAVRRGCGIDLLINIALLFLAWIPAVFHAWYVILRHPGSRERKMIERRSQEFGGRRSSSSRRSYDRRHHAPAGPPPPRYEVNEPMSRYTPPSAYHHQHNGYVPSMRY